MIGLRVLVCGGRDYRDRLTVIRELDRLAKQHADASGLNTSGNWMPANGFTIIHGGCPTGADLWADEWAVINWITPAVFKPDWDTYGRAAGPIRNARMIAEGAPDSVLAFPGGKGTADMIRRARAAGVRVIEIPIETG